MADAPRADIVFEISWEVCNKVGGIHTVIKSKLGEMQEIYANHVSIGPLFEQASQEFIPKEPTDDWKDVLSELEKQGIRCAYGAWRHPREPAVVLVDGNGLKDKRNDLKRAYWERFGIDSLHASWEFDEPMLFSTAAGILVETYLNQRPCAAVIHCHEWMAGFALLHAKARDVKAGTVFTTHATMLGRSIMGNGHDLYAILEGIDAKRWAYELNVQDKHLAEVACAANADVFTTVSEITGKEAAAILGREPDVLLFNGFTIDAFPTFEETSLQHYKSKEQLKELFAYTFFPHYTFNLDKVLFFYTAGRYEFGNKGMDVLIDALGILNARLKEEKQDLTVAMLFFVLMGRQTVKMELLENKNFFSHVRSTVHWQSRPLLQKVVFDLLSSHPPGHHDVTTEFIKDLHGRILPLRREGNPASVTHEISDPSSDPVLAACSVNGLLNREEDRVKVMLYPGHLDGSDGLLNLPYYDATVGTHLGIFPSHYEPWGYTPLESAALSVPAITTDLAGFGRYIDAHRTGAAEGIFIVSREGKARDAVVQELAAQLLAFTRMTRQERIRHGFAAKTLSGECSWEQFIPRYVRAHNLALERR